MKRICILVLIVCLIISVRDCAAETQENGEYKGQQQVTGERNPKVHFRLNLEKGFSCNIVCNYKMNITQTGQSNGTGEWKITANLLLKCADVDKNKVMTISQSPLKVWVEGTGIEGKHEVDFNSPEKNLRIPEMVRGHILSFLTIKSVRINTNGDVIAARQSPDKNNFDFMAMGRISYEDEPEWIMASKEKDTEIKYIISSMVGVSPYILGKEITVGKTLTTNKKMPEIEYNAITLKSIQGRIAYLEFKTGGNNEHKRPDGNEYVDETEQFNYSSEGLLEANIDTGLVYKCKSSAESDYRIMTYVPLLKSRTPTMSNNSKIQYSFEIVKK